MKELTMRELGRATRRSVHQPERLRTRRGSSGGNEDAIQFSRRGKRTFDESGLFEALTLGVFQAGLSWLVVFGKRDPFRRAFHGFDVARVAAMTESDVDRLVQDATIIRNRAKIQATIDNARAMSSASPRLAELARSTRAPVSVRRGLSRTSPHRHRRRTRSASS
jgi:3-methyladenine DNA glycosylase Tag